MNTLQSKENINLNSILREIQRGKNKTRRRVLITGGAGYVGSVLIRDLLDRGYEVKVLDKLVYGEQGIKDLYNSCRFSLVKGDIVNLNKLIETMGNINAVIHLAGIVGDPATKLYPRKSLGINLFANKAIADIARSLRIPKFIFASSCSVYGVSSEKCLEESDLNPVSLYAETNAVSEKELLNVENQYVNPTVLRFATVYGFSPRMRFDLVVNLLIMKALKEGLITVYGKGKQVRPFCHVKDISRAIIKVLESPSGKVSGEIFNVGSENQNMTIKKLATRIKTEVPGAKLEFISEKEDNRSYAASFEKIRTMLDFKTRYNIQTAVEEIRAAIQQDKIVNYTDEKYNNYKFLKNAY